MDQSIEARVKRSSMLIKLIIGGSLLLAGGCGREEPAVELSAFDGQRAYEEVAALVFYSPRDGGTEGGRRAAEHILGRLKAMGLDAHIDAFEDATPEGVKPFRNVMAMLPGKTDRWILLASHFDTMPGIPDFQGANDSGSSTGVLLELARLCAEYSDPPEVGIYFLFFDGEEAVRHYAPSDGLHGSRHFAASLKASGRAKSIDALYLLDMVGDRTQHFELPANSSLPLVREVLQSAAACGYRERFSLGRGAVLDDHVPFLEIGIPAVDIIDFNYGSAPGLNDYWHTPNDRMEHISVESLQVIGDIMRNLLLRRAFR